MELERLQSLVKSLLVDYLKQIYQGPVSVRVVDTKFDPKDPYYGYVVILTNMVAEVDMDTFQKVCDKNELGVFVAATNIPPSPEGKNDRMFSLFIPKPSKGVFPTN